MRVENDAHVSASFVHKSVTSRRSHFSNRMRSNSPMKAKRKHSHIFQLCYTDLCSQHNIPMIFPIKAHLHKRMLDFNGDRVKLDEWRPILKALSLDRSLHLIAIRSKNSCTKVLEHIDTETKSRTVIKLPVLLTNFIFRRLVLSLSRCLCNNSHLKCLELDGLLLSGDYLETLLAGLEKSSSLQHLSLHRCPLGDEGCQLVCNALRNLPNVLTLDLSGCNLSGKGAYFIARTLQYQNLNRYGENWKQSLRYRTPDTDIMPGLRRVTLNHNPLIGDSGVGHIINVLRDDLWLKALDLQNVGLTNTGGMEVLDLLQVNKSMSVVDVHNNQDLDKSIFESIMNMLATNNLGKISEYHWIQEDTLYLPRKPSYQSRDPSFVQRPLKSHDANQESHSTFNGGRAIRLTKSSTIPHPTSSQMPVAKTRSASAVVGTKLMERKTSGKALPGHPFRIKERNASLATKTSKWDHINASGDVGHDNDVRAKLRELSSKLEEEKQKRLQAEKRTADLELKLTELSQEREGRILMDSNVVKEIAEAFAVFNCFLAVFSRGGLQLGKADCAEQLSIEAFSDKMSNKSISPTTSESDVEEYPDGVTGLTLPLSSLTIQEWKTEEIEDLSESEGSSQTTGAQGVPDSYQKCKNGDEDVFDKQCEAKSTSPITSEKSPQSCLQKVLNDIFHFNEPTLNLKDVLKTDALSFVLNRQNDLPQKFHMNGSTDSTPRNDNESVTDKGGNFVLYTSSSESLYTNAEQAAGYDVEDSNNSWVSYSGDTSPTSTLTELNTK